MTKSYNWKGDISLPRKWEGAEEEGITGPMCWPALVMKSIYCAKEQREKLQLELC